MHKKRADCLGEHDKHQAETALVFKSSNAHQLRMHKPCRFVLLCFVGYFKQRTMESVVSCL